jgi:hypothetical protein
MDTMTILIKTLLIPTLPITLIKVTLLITDFILLITPNKKLAS